MNIAKHRVKGRDYQGTSAMSTVLKIVEATSIMVSVWVSRDHTGQPRAFILKNPHVNTENL